MTETTQRQSGACQSISKVTSSDERQFDDEEFGRKNMTFEDPGKKNAESRKLQQQLTRRCVPSRNHGFSEVQVKK